MYRKLNTFMMKRKLSSILKDHNPGKAQSLLVPGQSSSSSSSSSSPTTFSSSSSSSLLPPEVKKQQAYCSICMEEKQNHEMFNKMGCEHSYCINCTELYISTSLKQGMLHFKCPEPTCKDGVLAPEKCRKILPEKIYSWWMDALCEAAFPASLKLYCPFKDCSALLVWNDDDDDDDDEKDDRGAYNVCPHCKREFCVKCRVAWHSKLTCGEYKRSCEENDDTAFKHMADGLGWKRCPKCSFYVQRSSGCSHILVLAVFRVVQPRFISADHFDLTRALFPGGGGGGGRPTLSDLDPAMAGLPTMAQPIHPPAPAAMPRANGDAIGAASSRNFWRVVSDGSDLSATEMLLDHSVTTWRLRDGRAVHFAKNRTTSRDGQHPPRGGLPFFPGTE